MDFQTESPTIHGEYQWTMGEWLRMVPGLVRGGTWFVVGFVCALFGGLVSVTGGGSFWSLLMAVYGIGLMTGWIFVPTQWWSIRGKKEILEARNVIEANATQLRVTAPYAQSVVNWSAFRPGGRETKTMFVLINPNNCKMPIPKSAFSDADGAAFRQLLTDRGLIGEVPSGGR